VSEPRTEYAKGMVGRGAKKKVVHLYELVSMNCTDPTMQKREKKGVAFRQKKLWGGLFKGIEARGGVGSQATS